MYMKKMALLLSLWLCFPAWFSTVFLPTENAEDYSIARDAAVMILPSSLQEIGESAFENTAAETIVISDSTAIIGERAFVENRLLRTVHIPSSVTYMGEHTFEGSLNVKIIGDENSYAAAWALLHHVDFLQTQPLSYWLSKLENLLRESTVIFIGLICIFLNVQYWQRRKTENGDRSMRPQDRPELYPIQYRFP
jgi:hypothetical protein